MLLDARTLASESELRADVCVIGAGAAGLTVAQELLRHGLDIVVLESGGIVPRVATQRLAEGVVSGRPYYPLDECRFRALGGTTAAWGGWSRPLDESDFKERDWIPNSGWPFGREALRAYYKRAHDVCGLPAGDAELPTNTSTIRWNDNEDFQNTIVRIRPTRFGDVFGPLLRESPKVTLVLGATVTGLTLGRGGRQVTDARVATVGKTRLSVTAGVFVLALGGIDNARLLLCSRDENGMAIGNEHDLVGRYFADHLHVAIGVLTVPDGVPSLYRARENGDGAIRGVVALTEAAQQRLHAHGFAITMHDAGDPYDIFSIAQRTAGHRSVQALLGPIRKRHRPERLLHHLATATAHAPEVGRLVYRRVVRRSSSHVVLACRAEQAPNPESRVTLSAEVDRFGVPKARLDWRLSDADLGSIERSQAALASALEGSTLEMIPRDDGRGGGWATSISGGAHHIGTTRMHSDARYGVVDANCRVHGPSNVYVAGSSVFPTGGWAPPTLTIVALALRLADHLASSGSA